MMKNNLECCRTFIQCLYHYTAGHPVEKWEVLETLNHQLAITRTLFDGEIFLAKECVLRRDHTDPHPVSVQNTMHIHSFFPHNVCFVNKYMYKYVLEFRQGTARLVWTLTHRCAFFGANNSYFFLPSMYSYKITHNLLGFFSAFCLQKNHIGARDTI